MSASKRTFTQNLCGRRVKLARIEAGLNQLELATLLKMDFDLSVDQNSISMLEKGNRFVKDFEIIALAKALNKNPLWLLFGDKIPAEFK